ncbi:MAG: metallophosphoesterase, partial [Actinobacteria bacterium]|nr:metallophosphoesterase [Actinomycetota bacterium]
MVKVRNAAGARPFLWLLILVIGLALFITFPSIKKAEADFWDDVGKIPANWPWKISNVVYPTIGNPAFVKKGDNLTIEFDYYGKGSASQPATIDWWDVWLYSSNDDWPARKFCAEVSEARQVSSAWPPGSGPWGGKEVWKVTVNVPASTREDLYDIRVMAGGPGGVKTDWQRHAVQVVDQYKESFNFIHISDFHINDPRGPGVDLAGFEIPAGPANPEEFDPPNAGGQFPYYKYNRKAVDNVNRINPDFVVMTGDTVFGVPIFLEPPFHANATGVIDYTDYPENGWKGEYYYAYEHIMRLEVPIFLVPGNHDTYYLYQSGTDPPEEQPSNGGSTYPNHLLQDGAGLWPTYFGPLYFSCDYGNKAHFTNYWGYDKPPADRGSWKVPILGYWCTPTDANASIRATQMSFLDSDLAAADGNYNVVSLNGHHAFGGAHEAFSDAASLSQMQTASVSHHVDFSLSGHTHSDAVGTDGATGDTLHINTTTTSMGTNEYPGFRHVFVDGSTISPYYYQPTAFSHPTYKDTLIIYHPDSESAREHFATLHTPSIPGGFNTSRPDVTEKYFQVWNYFDEGNPEVTLDNMVQDFVMVD